MPEIPRPITPVGVPLGGVAVRPHAHVRPGQSPVHRAVLPLLVNGEGGGVTGQLAQRAVEAHPESLREPPPELGEAAPPGGRGLLTALLDQRGGRGGEEGRGGDGHAHFAGGGMGRGLQGGGLQRDRVGGGVARARAGRGGGVAGGGVAGVGLLLHARRGRGGVTERLDDFDAHHGELARIFSTSQGQRVKLKSIPGRS